MRYHVSYSNKCPTCLQPVPSFYKQSYYKAFVDSNEREAQTKFFGLSNQIEILKTMTRKIPNEELFEIMFEVG